MHAKFCRKLGPNLSLEDSPIVQFGSTPSQFIKLGFGIELIIIIIIIIIIIVHLFTKCAQATLFWKEFLDWDSRMVNSKLSLSIK